jgi:hypothetical protein
MDHGEGGQLEIAGSDVREDGAGRPGKGQLPGGTTSSRNVAEVPVLAEMRNTVVKVIIAVRVVREPGGGGSSGAACANLDWLY